MKIVGLGRKRLKDSLDELVNQRNRAETINAIIEIYMSDLSISFIEDMPEAPFEEELFEELKQYEWFCEENMQTIRYLMAMGAAIIFKDPSFMYMLGESFSDNTGNVFKGFIPAIKELLVLVMGNLKYHDASFYADREFCNILKNIKSEDARLYIERMPIKKGRLLFDDDIYSESVDFCYQLAMMTEDVMLPIVCRKDEDKRNCVTRVLFPDEINTAERVAKKAHGDVLCIGTKTGYLEFILSQKEDVESVTVVDNKENIELFNTLFRPQFPNNEKITTIDGNWKDVVSQKHYDSIFMNMRINDQRKIGDYIEMRKYEKETGANFYYLTKESFVENIKTLIFVMLSEMTEFEADEELPPDMQNNEIYEAKNIIEPYLRDYMIKSIDDIRRLMSEQAIDEIF